MRYLGQPDLGHNARSIFETCARGYNDENIVRGLLECSAYINRDEETFARNFPESLSDIENPDEYPNGITRKQFKDLYKTKFARLNSPGRMFYDCLLSFPRGKICPICGERVVSNLDHYLPESVYSTLVVTPNNLVAICRDCNFIKLDYENEATDRRLLHPYFDYVDGDVWLKTRLLPDMTFEYFTDCPNCWSDSLRLRLQNHIYIYKLHTFYSIKAGQEVANSLNRWESILTRDGEDGLLGHLIEEKQSKEAYHLNSWKSALYRGLITDFRMLIANFPLLRQFYQP